MTSPTSPSAPERVGGDAGMPRATDGGGTSYCADGLAHCVRTGGQTGVGSGPSAATACCNNWTVATSPAGRPPTVRTAPGAHHAMR